MSMAKVHDTKCKPFYLNLVLLNKDEILASKVTEKAGTGYFGKAATFAASKLVSDDKVMGGLSSKLIEGVTKAVKDMGITAELENKFQQGPLVVIRVQIADVDTMKLVTSAKGPEFAQHFANLLTAVNGLGMGETVGKQVDEKIYGNIHDGMITKFRDLIPSKLAEQGVDVECQVVTTEEQAEVFFDILTKLNTAAGK